VKDNYLTADNLIVSLTCSGGNLELKKIKLDQECKTEEVQEAKELKR